MRKILEDFYYGNLTPGEQEAVPNSELQRATAKAAQCEQQLIGQLAEKEKATFVQLVSAQHTINSITAVENFILGFRLGIRMMAECMDDNDGDIWKIADDG